MADERRVRWKSRRGMKELDVMLERYLDERWPVADEEEREAFAELLELQDPELWSVIAGNGPFVTHEGAMIDVVEWIRESSGH